MSTSEVNLRGRIGRLVGNLNKERERKGGVSVRTWDKNGWFGFIGPVVRDKRPQAELANIGGGWRGGKIGARNFAEDGIRSCSTCHLFGAEVMLVLKWIVKM